MRNSVFGTTLPDAHEFQHIARVDRIDFDARAHAQLVPIDADPAIVRARLGKRHRQRCLRQSVDRDTWHGA